MKIALSETVQKIIDGRATETYSNGFLGINRGTRIKLKSGSTEKGLFTELYHKTCELFGEPTAIHSYYGFIWDSGNGFLTLSTVQEGYDWFSYNFFIFEKMPHGNKLSYRDYSQTVETVKRIFAEHGLSFKRKDGTLTLVAQYYNNKQFSFLAEGENTQCLLTIKRNYMFFGYSRKEVLDKGMARIKPLCAREKKMRFTDPAVIERELKSCFEEASKKQ